MSSLVYLLREPVSTLSPALYAPVDQEWKAVVIEDSDPPLSKSSGKDEAPHNTVHNYKDLLNLILKARKVITL